MSFWPTVLSEPVWIYIYIYTVYTHIYIYRYDFIRAKEKTWLYKSTAYRNFFANVSFCPGRSRRWPILHSFKGIAAPAQDVWPHEPLQLDRHLDESRGRWRSSRFRRAQWPNLCTYGQISWRTQLTPMTKNSFWVIDTLLKELCSEAKWWIHCSLEKSLPYHCIIVPQSHLKSNHKCDSEMAKWPKLFKKQRLGLDSLYFVAFCSSQ